MNGKLGKFFSQPPEIVINWQDDYTPAKGWLVINSLRGGAAGGGTRIRPGCTKEEVTELAKTMEIKFTISGPEIGGAKSGIDYDFKDLFEKQAVLKRWFAHILVELKTHYGTGGDQNVDQTRDVIPILGSLGINHPQEGIVRGFRKELSKSLQDKIIANLNRGTQLPVQEDILLNRLRFTISDIATGYGIAKVLEVFFLKCKKTVQGKKILVEGFGNVGKGAAYLLYSMGAKVVGIFEKDWQIFNEQGLDMVNFLRMSMAGDWKDLDKYGEIVTSASTAAYPSADIFVPAATSHTITDNRIGQLKSAGIDVIVCGANNPFSSVAVSERADVMFSIIPDFIANAGMARVYAYLMQLDAHISESAILGDLGDCLTEAIEDVWQRNNSARRVSATAEDIAVEKIYSSA